MFRSKRGGTVIAEGLTIVGSVTAEGLVEVNGQNIAPRSLSLRKPRSPAPSRPSEWSWTGGSRAPFKAERWFSSRRRMSSVIFTTNLLPLRRAPISRAARYKHMEPTGAEGECGKSQAIAARPMLQAEQAADRFQMARLMPL
jgi:hypothetical protein